MRRIDIVAVGGVEIPRNQAARIRAEQIETFKGFGLWVVFGNTLNSGLIAAAFWNTPARETTLWWLLAIAILMTIYLHKWLNNRGRAPARSRPPRAMWLCVRDTAVQAGVWAMMPVLLLSSVDPSTSAFAATVIVGTMSGGAFMLSTIPLAGMVFVGLTSAGTVAGLALTDHPLSWLLIVLLSSYAAILMAGIAWASRVFVARLLGEALATERAEVIGLLLHDFEDAASDWLWSTDTDGRLISGDGRFAELAAARADGLKTAAFADLFADGKPRQELEGRIGRRESFSDLVMQIGAGERNAWVALTGKPILEDGKFIGYRGVASDETVKRENESRIAYMATHDALTGLPNRQSLIQMLGERLAGCGQSEASCALLLLDLDEFKRINDSLGHSAGDLLLVEAARRICKVVGDDGAVARLGGDEFAIVLCHDADTVERFSGEIIEALDAPFDLDGAVAHCSASIGIRQIDRGDQSPEHLLKHADLALYEAKAKGRHCAAVFESRMDGEAKALLRLGEDLRTALAGDQLRLVYQPIIRASTGQVEGCEALLRWQHPDKGLLTPAHFIDIAETSGLIVPLGEWVIRTAIRAASRLPEHLSVAINISPIQMRSPGLVSTIINALSSSGVNPARLEVEITESVLLDGSENNTAILRSLQNVGVRISLDDFGTGYSSFSYLRRFSFDKIKVDKSFIDHICDDARDQGIMTAIVTLSRILDIRTVAEGVETADQSEAVRRIGCDQIQGYFFSRPLPLEDFANRVGANLDAPAARTPEPAIFIDCDEDEAELDEVALRS